MLLSEYSRIIVYSIVNKCQWQTLVYLIGWQILVPQLVTSHAISIEVISLIKDQVNTKTDN